MATTTDAALQLFNDLIASGDYYAAGALASSYGYGADAVASYLNTNYGSTLSAADVSPYMAPAPAPEPVYTTAPAPAPVPVYTAPAPSTTAVSRNLTPKQLQQFTGYLTPEMLTQIYGGLADDMLPGGYRPQLGYEWDSMEAQVSGGPGRAILTGFSSPIGPDNMYNAYSPTGEFLGRYKAEDDSLRALLPIAMALGGQFLFGGGFPSLGLGTGAGSSALGQGAWLGEGIASGIPAWDAAALSAGNTLAGVSPALLDAQFIAADAAQLAAQTGNNVAAIQQNLIAAGVDPIVAATAADAAALGLTGSELITTIAGAGQTGAGLFTGGSVVDLALGGITTTTGAPAGSTVTGGGTTTGGGSGTTTGGGGGTTTTTGGLPTGVTTTLTNLLTNPNTLASLLGLFGGRALGGGVPTGLGSIPTQGIPVNTPEYFNQVQGFLNQYLPGQMPNQAQYLQSWYGSGNTLPSGGGVFSDTSVLQQVGLMPKTSVSPVPLRPTTPLPPPPPPPPPPPATGVSLEDIRAYLGARPGLTDAEIAAAMDQYGVTAAQMSAATGVPFAEVLNRYQEATGRVAFPAGMFSTPGIVLSPSDYARPTDSGGGGGVSTQQIVDFLEANPGMSDAAIASAMDQYGVTASQMATATGVPLAEVMQRYEAATGRPAFPAGMFS